jgi:hypothetical protein
MTVATIRKTLTSLVNQRRKVFGMSKYIAGHLSANQRALRVVANNVGYLNRCEKLESWVRMTVRHESEILQLLPGKKYSKQRDRVLELMTECKTLIKSF